MEIKIGTKGIVTDKVTEENTAKTVGSGSLDVFATPSMIALMEKASCVAIESFLDEGATTVGTMINAEHLSATPIGCEITVESIVTAVEGRRISFEVTACDTAGLIGKGTHDRFIVDKERFMSKANTKNKL